MTKQELASKIWAMADKMRSKIKANEYKDYILGFMFYKFLSDKEYSFLKEQGFEDNDIELMDNEMMEFTKENIGYAISYEDLFSTWKNKGIALDVKAVSEGLSNFNKNINIAQKSVFENIFNTLQNGIDKLGDSSGSKSKAVRDIVDMIDQIPTNTTQGYDVLGYIYEFLIYKFATAAKDDGAFYTPHEVSSLIAMIIANKCKNLNELKVYDPTSGSGSLLLNIGEEASKYIDKNKIKYYGQEKITETYHLTRMNLIMKGVPSQNVIVRNGDTLEDDWPYFDDDTAYQTLRVDAVVSNPPYSLHWDAENRSRDERFKKYGLAPSGKADYAFLLHCLYHMENDGIMAIVLPHGVLFRGDSEYNIRKNLCIEHNIETIIGLPANLFFATSIPTIIMILRKNRSNDDILFIDASQNYEKGKNQNILRDCDIKRIFDAVIERKDIENFSKLVSFKEIKENDFNLNIPRYVSANTDNETYDFAALMNGTIPNKELEKYKYIWDKFKTLKKELYADLDNEYSKFNNVIARDTINNNNEVKSFISIFNTKILKYKNYLVDILITNYDKKEKNIKEKVVNKLFDIIQEFEIIDKYNTYQLLMNNWATLETDFTIIGNNKTICRNVEDNIIIKKIKNKETEVKDGRKGTIIPFDLVGETYFHTDYSNLKILKNKIEELETEILDIYNNFDEDLKGLIGDGEKPKESELKKYIKQDIDTETKENLQKILNNLNEKKNTNKEIKNIESEILNKIELKINELTDEEIDDMLTKKWIDPIITDISSILNVLFNEFSNNINKLNEKYANPLSEIDKEIEKANSELCGMLKELEGSEIDMKAIQTLISILS